MIQLSAKEGRIDIHLKALTVGEDLCVIVSGGDKPHIGCVTVSVPRPSLAVLSDISATTSVINFIGHKDDEVARDISHKLSSTLNKNVVVTCGIHIDQIKVEEIETVKKLIEELTVSVIHELS